ncbi:MAG TPA: C1 family peptidase, partial [Methylobacter sp.]
MFKRKLYSSVLLFCGLFFSVFAYADDEIPAYRLGASPPTIFQPAPGFDGAPDLPASIDLSAWAAPIGNQGDVGSCVAWAIVHGMLGWYANRYGGPAAPRQGFYFAPMYVYSQVNLGAAQGQDRGTATAMDAMSLLASQGVDTQSHYNKTESPLAADYFKGDFDWKTQPTADEIANAAQYRIGGYNTLFAYPAASGLTARANGIYAIKAALAASQPVAITMRIGWDFFKLAPYQLYDDTSIYPGYHEVLAVGYDQQGLLLQNSWGTGWGTAGFARMAWATVDRNVIEANIILPPSSAPSIVEPFSQATLSGTIKLAAVQGFNPNARSLTFWVDGPAASSAASCVNSLCITMLDTMKLQLANGPHIVEARTYDAAGAFLERSPPVVFNLLNDHSPPVVH